MQKYKLEGNAIYDDINVKYTYNKQKRTYRSVVYFQISLSIMLWYTFSVFAAIVNKALTSSDNSVNPLTLTFFHVFISCICDSTLFQIFLYIAINMVLFHQKEFSFYLHHFDLKLTVRYFIPLSLTMMFAKTLTYKSYSIIPISLTHTVKALQPFFNVLIVFLWTHEMVDINVLLSLIPIVVGVIYASVSDVEFVWVGFICALISTIISVFQGIYLKMLMKMGLDKNYVHLCNATLSCCILLPVVIFIESRNTSYHKLQWKGVVISALLQYLSSLSSYSAMYLLSSLSYSITSTLKRVVIIVTTSIYFRKHLTFGNIVGVIIATIGAILYNIANRKSKKIRKLPSLKKRKEFSYENFEVMQQ